MRGALGLVALLLASAWLALPAGAQGANSDLGVRSFAVRGVPRVNGSVDVSVVVTNAGPGPAAQFALYFGFDDASHPLNGTNGTSSYAYPVDSAPFTVEDAQGPCAQQVVGAPLGVGCSLRANLTWFPNASQQGAHQAVVRVSVPAPGTDPEPGNDTAAQPVFVELHDLRLGLDARDARAKGVAQGDAAPYRATLANRGNVAEQVLLAVRADAWPGGGSVVPGSVLLAPGASVTVLGLVRSPGDGGGAPSSGAELTARNLSTPLGNASLALPATSLDAAAPSYGFALDPPAGETLVDPGGQGDLALRVRDTGGTEDAVRVQVSGGAPGWTVTLPAPFAVVPAGRDARGDLVVRAAADAGVAPGTPLNVTVSATSVNRAALQDSRTVTFRASAPDLAVGSVRFDEPAVYAGDTVHVRVEVRNAGNVALAKPARVELAALRGPESFPVDGAVVNDIPPGDARIVVLTWDTAGFSGAYDLRLRLDPGGDVAELHEDNNERTFPVVVRTHALGVDAPPPREAKPGQELRFAGEDAFRVRNLGNAAEDVQVRISTPDGWLQQASTLSLGPGEVRALAFTLQVPARPGRLDEALTASAVLANRTSTVATNATRIAINDTDPPLLLALHAPDFVELGEPAAFRAVLTDAVGVRSAVLTLREPDGTQRTAALSPQAQPDTWGADVVLAQPGTVSYWLTAVDATPRNNTLDTRSDPGAVLVGVRSAPLIELVEPRDGASVRPGSQLRLRITDVHGVGAVSVRDGARTFELGEPYSIATNGWEEGRHTVDVTARNRYGNAASLEFNVTIDGTPPVVRDARVEPARPGPGQPFTVSASASRDAVRAALQVRQAGQLLREVPAGLASQVASATLSLPAGNYVLSVRVEDEAGNAASADVGVAVGAALPGFEALLVLAALGLARAAARR